MNRTKLQILFFVFSAYVLLHNGFQDNNPYYVILALFPCIYVGILISKLYSKKI